MTNDNSITPTAVHWLTTTRQARVLHLFDSACNLVNETGAVLSLLAAEHGRAPFALTLTNAPHFPSHFSTESAVRVGADALWVGEWHTPWRTAALWNPRPAWESIPAANLTAAWPILRGLLIGRGYITPPAELTRADEVAAWLIGRGPGLTPAGDDFLMGWLYALWAKDEGRGTGDEGRGTLPSPQSLVPTPHSRTTTLSAAYLQAASQGEAAETWHNLVAALTQPSSEERLTAAAQAILAIGHTSGADALAGFVWAGQGEQKNQRVSISLWQLI